jgi:hypothetical protein
VRHHLETSKALAPSKWTGQWLEVGKEASFFSNKDRGLGNDESRIFRKGDLELKMATAFDYVLDSRSRERQASTEHEARVASEDRETDLQWPAAGSVS